MCCVTTDVFQSSRERQWAHCEAVLPRRRPACKSCMRDEAAIWRELVLGITVGRIRHSSRWLGADTLRAVCRWFEAATLG